MEHPGFSDYSPAFQETIRLFMNEFEDLAKEYFEHDREILFDDWLEQDAVDFCLKYIQLQLFDLCPKISLNR